MNDIDIDIERNDHAVSTVVLDTRRMRVGTNYWLLYSNVRTVATKRPDGSINFYRVPDWVVRWFGWLIWTGFTLLRAAA